ncbi:TolC family outer membrane protein [Pseudoroseicyclus aestuarii]|uniref:Outer membrane protein n=1 Tax=Pseudoroseicyclus aestuarii TaxID=1795041 RepID=A0A318SR22_9RHOB|nr:TolC family outer membrane protein [Pseudoroseicyclus aestuarii]PYE84032.1 outer membrane protein [Pseudoroseicyclus aestuarii]
MTRSIKARLLGFAVWCGAAAIPAASLQAETLSDALSAGYENSGLLEQNRALLRAADEDVAQAVAALRPVLSWSASASTSWPRENLDRTGQDYLQTSLGLTAQLTIYDGGLNQLAVEAQKETVLATRESLRGVESDVLLRIVQAYLEVQRASSSVDLRQNNIRLIGQELQAAQDRFEVGEVTRTDVSLAEAQLAAARGLLASEQGGLTQAIEEFRAAVGRAPDNLAAVPLAPIPDSLEQAQQIARRNAPDLLQAQRQVTIAELNIRRAAAARRPNVALQGTLGLDPNNDFEDSEQLSLSVQSPIYQGGALSSAVRQIQNQRDAARNALIYTARQIDQSVANAYSLLAVARATRTASAAQVRASNVAFDGVREEATLGARTTLDVLDAEQDLLDARTSLVSAEVDETLATYSILAAIGLLTAEHLELPVQIYDPSAYYNLVSDAPAGMSPQGQALDRVLQSIGH